MTAAWDILQMVIFVVALVAITAPLGGYMARVFGKKPTFLDKVMEPLERLIYRVTGVNEREEMTWKGYAVSVLLFNGAGMLFLYLLQRLQGYLPWNPERLGSVARDLAFNTAASFMTNTNWQAYAGESTMSYLTQMAGLTVQNFVSAGTGIAVAVAFMRGIVMRTTKSIGNFWVDLTRSVLWILLPMSVVLALVLVSQGVIQNLSPYVTAKTIEGSTQIIVMGPVASQEAIKEVGTNGGGPFNANSAHPFENPTPLSNFLEMLAILAIPAGLTYTFGKMAGDSRQGWAIFGAMLFLFAVGLGVVYSAEALGNPAIHALNLSGPSAMEGKELRFGIGNSALFATVTTAASCGAVNAMHDSLTPMGGFVPLLQIMLGEVVFGGVGAGFYGMMMFVILTVFIVGLMVGRTPEYLGKKVESWEMKMAILAVLIPAAAILLGSAGAAATTAGRSSVLNPGPHGLSEILYAFSSGAGNNGSAFAGLNANTPFYNLAIGFAMIIGRFGVILPALAIAGSMGQKKATPPGPGTFPTRGMLFMGLLAGIVLIVGALTFFPALALGPIVEHLLMLSGKMF